jgi:hypothetical protein
MAVGKKKEGAEDALLGLLSGKKKTPENALLEVLAPKKKEVDKETAKSLVGILPRKEDSASIELFDEIQKVSSEIDVKKANAIGLSLVNVLKKSKVVDQDPEVKKEIQMRFGDMITDIVKGLMDKEDEKYDDVYQLAVGSLYKYLNDDLKKILRKQKDVMDGKVQYYKDDPSYSMGVDVGGGGFDENPELEAENSKLKSYINILERIYQSDIISYANSPYGINYTVANVILADASEGNMVIRMPDPALNIGRPFVVKKIDTTSNTVTILPYGSETFDGDATRVINSNDGELEYVIYSIDGVNWTTEGDADIIGLFLLGELVWGDFNPQYEWRDFSPTIEWHELNTQTEFRRPRAI